MLIKSNNKRFRVKVRIPYLNHYSNPTENYYLGCTDALADRPEIKASAFSYFKRIPIPIPQFHLPLAVVVFAL